MVSAPTRALAAQTSDNGAKVKTPEVPFEGTPTPTPGCSQYNYTIAAGTVVPGTTDIGNHTDDGSTLITLPFNYTLYSQTFNQVSAGSNGHLTFGTVDNSFNLSCIPITGPTYAIGPYWTDQCTGPCFNVTCTGCGIFTSVSGTAPSRIFNVEYRTAYYNSGGDGVRLDYEVRLYEGQTRYDIVYGAVPAFSPPSVRNLSVGVQRTSAFYTLVGCDPTGGQNPPVSAGQLYVYTLSACTTATPSPAITNTPTATRTNTPPPGATNTPGACTTNFADVPTTHTFYAWIHCLACRGIINGYACGSPGEPCNGNNDPYFRPGGNITRAQIAKIITLAADITTPIPNGQQTFEDVAPATTFWIYIERLAGVGAMSGYDCGGPGEPCVAPGNRPYFRQNALATRGQLTKIVSQAAGYTDPIPTGTQHFQDVPSGHTFYDYVERLLIHNPNAMSGYTCGGVGEPCIGPGNLPYFRPGSNVTRGQGSKIVASIFFPECDPLK